MFLGKEVVIRVWRRTELILRADFVFMGHWEMLSEALGGWENGDTQDLTGFPRRRRLLLRC